jgi:hypothetical protein
VYVGRERAVLRRGTGAGRGRFALGARVRNPVHLGHAGGWLRGVGGAI